MHVFFFIFYRVMAPVVHQVPLQVGLQGGHQLRKAIQSGQRDLNHSLHRGRLAHRVVDLPVLIPILDRGLQCIQVMKLKLVVTAPCKKTGLFAILRSKMAFFKSAWWKVKLLSRPWASSSTLPLIRPLK